MTINPNEETEMTQEFGQLVRILTGSSMQMREAAYHRNVAKAEAEVEKRIQQEQQQKEELIAESVNDKLRSESLWANQDATEIADHVVVAAHLGETHDAALDGYNYAADMLRDNYGINLAEMNRDHPTSWADQHEALQQALSDHFEAQQKEAEAEQLSNQPEQETQDLEEEAEADAEQLSNEPDHEPQAKDLESEADAARQSEGANLQRADDYAAEQSQDERHAQQEASTGGRQPAPYQRVTDAQREQLNSQNPGYGDTRQRQGKQFTKSSQERVNDTVSSGRSGRAVKQSRESNRRLANQKDLGVSR